MESFVTEATRLHAWGLPADRAAAEANWGPYASWVLSSLQGPIAVRKVYEELEEELK